MNHQAEYERLGERGRQLEVELGNLRPQADAAVKAQVEKIEAYVESEMARLYAGTSDFGRQLFDGVENFREGLVGVAVDLPPTKGRMPDIEGAWKLLAGSTILQAGIERAPSRQVRRDLERRLRKLETRYPIDPT